MPDDNEREALTVLMRANAKLLGITVPDAIQEDTLEMLQVIYRSYRQIAEHEASSQTEVAPVYRP